MPGGKFAGKGPATSKWALHKPRGQALVLGGALLSTPANQVRAFNFLWNQGHNVVAAATTLAPAYQAYRDDKRLTFGYGHKGSVKLGNIPYYGRYFSGTPRNLRVPTFGVGLTSKKVNGKKRKSNRGPSRRPGRGRKSGLGGPAWDPNSTNRFARRRRKYLKRKGRKCPNGYRYDPKRKMCVYKGL